MRPMFIFFAFLTHISDRCLSAAPRGSAGRFPGISGVGDAGKLKCRVNPVQNGLVRPANVGFFGVLDPDPRSVPIKSS